MYDPSIAAKAGQAHVGEEAGADLVEALARDFIQYLADSQGNEAGGDPRPPEGGEPAGRSPAKRADRGRTREDAEAVARALGPATAASDASAETNLSCALRPREVGATPDCEHETRDTKWRCLKAREANGLVLYKTSITLVVAEQRLKRVKQAVITAARLMLEQIADVSHGGFRWKPAFVTLTYRPGETWHQKDITFCLAAIREYLRRRGVPMLYDWVAEIQSERVLSRPGDCCLHYHVVVWLPIGMSLPKPDKRGWWPKGSTKIEWARKPVGYLAKYASKGGCLDYVPKGARLYGSGGLSRERRIERAWWRCPQWVREKWSQEHRPTRAKGGGWISRLTGEYVPSLWRFAGLVADGLCVILVPV